MLYQNHSPSLIKYMGSKSKILDFIIEGINSIGVKNNTVLDLFAGSASLSGAIGNQTNFVSNDIQNYSRVLSQTYLYSLAHENLPSISDITQKINEIVLKNIQKELIFDYKKFDDLESFNNIELQQRNLIHTNFSNEYHLFTKNYSGTWWSYEQCVWIDAAREVANDYIGSKLYPFILSALMYAMAYASQGTGHYAQYRDAKTQKSLKDISIYRKKSVEQIFTRKLTELISYGQANKEIFTNEQWSLDYKDALLNFNEGTVYADPPYCFVHYSRFYHILETLVLYDYPEIQTKKDELVKGRYRKDRHQSPFSIKSQVESAFIDMFKLVESNNSNLILSYSNTGMIGLEELSEIATSIWSSNRIEILTTNHQHMTLGRQGKRFRDVVECLFIVN